MAMFSLNPRQAESYLNSDEFKLFSTEISKKLNVKDLFSGIKYRDLEKKFPNKDSLAFTYFEDDYTQYEGTYFSAHRIVKEVESLYSSCRDTRKKEGILKVLINFLLIHELVHLSQFKRGYNKQLSKLAKSNIKEYKSSWLECEANLRAYLYLKRCDEFTESIARGILRACIK